MFLIHSLTDCKWPICMREISIFDLSLSWMKSLSAEAAAVMLIAIDATLWLRNNNWWYAAHVATFKCCSLQRPVSRSDAGARTHSTLAVCIARVQVRSRRLSAATALSRWVSPTSSLSPLPPSSSFRWSSVRWCAHGEKKWAVCSRGSNTLCQPAVPAVSAEIRLFCWCPHCVAVNCQPQHP